MIEYSRWKLFTLGLVLLFGIVYSVPNLFPQDSAVQISAGRGAVVDDALKERVQGVLEKQKIAFKRVELEKDRLLVRLPDSEVQIAAADALKAELDKDKYVVALNLASNVPAWLGAIHGKAMTLGLDLQGGVHFLMEVDQRATAQKQTARYVEDLRVLLREKGMQPRTVAATPQGIAMTFKSEELRDRAYAQVSRDIVALEVTKTEGAGDSWNLLANIRPADVKLAADNAIQQNVATLRNRINGIGVAEPIIQQQGSSRIVVELPGVQDTALAKKILGATATLEYRAVDMKNSVVEAAAGKVPFESKLYRDRQGNPVLLSKKLIVSGDQLTDASSGIDAQGGTPMVSVELNAVGAKRMQDFTNANVGNGMAVVFIERTPEIKIVDGQEQRTAKITEQVISVANVREPFGKRFQTTGLDSTQEASELALLLRAGALAAPVDIVEERTIGPSQGQDNIDRGMKATLVGFALVLLFMGIYYRVFGIIADLALIANTVLLTALLSMFGATLTMPGIAALLLTVGMAVDANVLICERIREELRSGMPPVGAIKAGYEKAWATIVDANVTHLISGIALFALGSGPIRGFALVLTLGILTSVFTAVTVSYAFVYLIYGRRRRLQTLSI